VPAAGLRVCSTRRRPARAESLHDSGWPWPSQQVHALRRKQASIGHQRMHMHAKVRHHAVEPITVFFFSFLAFFRKVFTSRPFLERFQKNGP
jgi:hypothetical protein